MKVFEAFIVQTNDAVRDLSTARLVLVLADTPDDAIAAFLAKYPGWTVEMTGRPVDGVRVEGLKPGEPT